MNTSKLRIFCTFSLKCPLKKGVRSFQRFWIIFWSNCQLPLEPEYMNHKTKVKTPRQWTISKCHVDVTTYQSFTCTCNSHQPSDIHVHRLPFNIETRQPVKQRKGLINLSSNNPVWFARLLRTHKPDPHWFPHAGSARLSDAPFNAKAFHPG